jgi:branched-chain amino acid transport system permease protein
LDRIQTSRPELVGSRYYRAAAIVVVAVLALFIPVFLHNQYILHLLIAVYMNAVLTMTFVMLFRTGLIHAGITAFYGIGAYSSALLATKLSVPVWAAMPCAVVITALISLLLGMMLVKRGGIAFVILTMVLSFIMVEVFGTFEVFGGRVGIFNIPTFESIPIPGGSIKFGSKTPYYYLMLVLLAIVILVMVAFYKASTGRAWRAIGLSPRLAESLGVSIFRYRLLAFVVSGAIAGLMGSFYAHYYWSIVPGTFGAMQALNYQVYAILGGINFAVPGPIIGSAILILVPEGLRISREIEPVYEGVIVILLVMFLPDGLLGLIRSWRRALHPVGNLGRVVEWVRTSGGEQKGTGKTG